MSDYRLPDGNHVILLSADTSDLLRAEAAALLRYVTEHPSVTPDRVSEMLFRTRTVRRVRGLVPVRTRDELVSALHAMSEGIEHPSVVGSSGQATERNYAFVFPGQGGQRSGMAALFHASSPAFRAEAARCDNMFRDLFDESPLEYALGDTSRADAAGASARLVQPALFLQMSGLAAMWREAGIEPALTVGHSQGEIAAAYVAGKMTLADAAFVVGTRARAVDTIASDEYAMAVVAADRDECEDLLARRSGWAQLSVVNSPGFFGISGDRRTVEQIVAALDQRGRFTRVIPVPYPAHTDLLDRTREKMLASFGERLSTTTFLDSDIECIGATLGSALTTDLAVPEYWFWNVRNTVRFDKAVAGAVRAGANSFVELAEHPTLELSIQDNLDVLCATPAATVTHTSTREVADSSEFSSVLATLAVGDLNFRWDCLNADPGRVRLPLRGFPNVQLDEKYLWLPHSGPNPCLPHSGPNAKQSGTRPARQVAAASTSTIAPRLLVERWVRQGRRTLLSPRAIGIIDHGGECADQVSDLCAGAAEFGATAREVTTADECADIDTVVILLPHTTHMDVPTAGDAIAAFFGEATWWPGAKPSVSDIWLVTRGGEQVIDGDPVRHLFQSGVAAGFRSIATEHPGMSLRHLDIAAGPFDAIPTFSVVAALHTAEETELALRGKDQYVKRLVEHPNSDAAQEIRNDTGQEILIVGGTGKIGLEFCEYFARRGVRRITLLSRSGETPEVSDRLARIRMSGSAEIVVHSCDARDRTAIEQIASEFRSRPVDLVVHTAVEYSDADLDDVTTETVRQAVATKVGAIANVLDSVARSDECRVLVSSSVASTLSGRGQIVYAATNRMLDAFADQRRAEGMACRSVQWGRWTVHLDLGVVGTAKLDEMGASPMEPVHAIELGLRDMGENTVVAAFDWARTSFELSDYGYGPVLSQLVGATERGERTPGGRTDRDPSGDATATPPRPSTAEIPGRFREILAEVLGIPGTDTIDTTRSMVSLGLDSLLALGLRRKVESELGRDIPMADLLGGASIDAVVQLLTDESVLPRSVSSTPIASSGRAGRGHGNGTDATDDLAERARITAHATIPADTDAARICSARGDLDIFGLRAMMGTIGSVLRDSEFHSPAEIAERTGFRERHLWLLRCWLHALTEHRILEYDTERGYRVLDAVAEPERDNLFEVGADLGYPPEFAAFMHAADENLPMIAQDRVRVQELLFPDGAMRTAESVYTDNLISRYLNVGAREFVAGLSSRIEQVRAPVRILELGAGIGGLTGTVVEGLGTGSVDYHFTDLSPFFLDAARERFAEYPWMRYGIVDLNAGLAEHGRYDIVLAANVLHNAQHIGTTLRQIHDLLDPGGAVVFVEVCRAHLQLLTSVHFLMSPPPGQPRVGTTDVRQGTDRIMLTEQEWRDELAGAGFMILDVLPHIEHPLNPLDQRVFAAQRPYDR